MIAALALFGLISAFILLGLATSRYFGRVVIGILQRHGNRLQALRPAFRAFSDEYARSLEFQRLQGRVMGE